MSLVFTGRVSWATTVLLWVAADAYELQSCRTPQILGRKGKPSLLLAPILNGTYSHTPSFPRRYYEANNYYDCEYIFSFQVYFK